MSLTSTSVAPSISDLIWILISSHIFARVDHPLASLDKAMSDWWMVSQGISNFNDAVAEIYTDFCHFMSGSTEGTWLALLMTWVVGKLRFLVFQPVLLVLSY